MMWATFIAAAAVLGLDVLGLGLNVLKGRDFPHYDVGSNEEMRRRGIRCYKDEDAALHRKKCDGAYSEACKECKLYEPGSDSRTSERR